MQDSSKSSISKMQEVNCKEVNCKVIQVLLTVRDSFGQLPSSIPAGEKNSGGFVIGGLSSSLTWYQGCMLEYAIPLCAGLSVPAHRHGSVCP